MADRSFKIVSSNHDSSALPLLRGAPRNVLSSGLNIIIIIITIIVIIIIIIIIIKLSSNTQNKYRELNSRKFE